MPKVITRYAPSPTGSPHVGNIHSAIFAYLWARHNKGKFLLRIEDTDRERLVPKSLEYIEESLDWLGLEYDGEKKCQSDHRKVHFEYANKLWAEGKAYKCFCSKERLDELREKQQKMKMPPGYDKHCRNLSKEEVLEKEKKGEKYVIRFAMPEVGKARWNDLIRGVMEIDFSVSDDPVIIKSDGWPTYHLASVIDDHESNVTDIIRGEEWIPSTPKHIALYGAFGWKIPAFAHIPHINGPDGSKLSKRHGDTAILDYRDEGYLPEAMMNFLAILGWNDGTEKEIFSKEELIKSFDIKKIGKSPAVFDVKKLGWINGQYIRKLSDNEIIVKVEELYPKEKILGLSYFDRIIAIEKTRLSKLSDILEGTGYFLTQPKYNPKILIFKKSDKEDTKKGIEAFIKKADSLNLDKYGISEYEDLLKEIVDNENLSNGDVFWPVRVALSGKEMSPSPAELLWVFGKEEALKRLGYADKVLS